MERGTQTKYPGITKLTDGRYVVRVQVPDPRTGKYRDTTRTLSLGTTEDEARKEQLDLKGDVARTGPVASRMKFNVYASNVIEGRIATGTVASPATIENYRYTLKAKLNEQWGDYFVDAITRYDVKLWLATLGRYVAQEKHTPETVNTWWRLFRSVMIEAAVDFQINDPTLKLKGISKGLHRTYTLEEPNSLLPEELPAFFKAAAELEPEHFAMIMLGTLTGRRTCELRPLRRRGPLADLNWDNGIMQIRRSLTVGTKPMEQTKTGKDVVLFLPPKVIEIFETHVGALKGQRAESDLLFPPFWCQNVPTADGYLTRWALRKPLAAICKAAKITKKITPKAMRRTYQDLCRAAGVSRLVQMSMSGHATDEMVAHYSTVAETEGRQALTKMLGIAGLQQLHL